MPAMSAASFEVICSLCVNAKHKEPGVHLYIITAMRIHWSTCRLIKRQSDENTMAAMYYNLKWLLKAKIR